MKPNAKWDQRFLALAAQVATWSQDPSTGCGAVIVRPDRTVASLGFNGFPRGMEDRETRYLNRQDKYARIIHAEINALTHAREPLSNFTLYCNLPVCHICALQVIQSGIKRVVYPKPSEDFSSRWGESAQKGRNYFEECGVRCDCV